ncbi:thioredoxin family protein [Chloroflexota bacterium]
MKIEICGTGCAKCHATMGNVQKVVKELGLEQTVEVSEVKDIMAISTKGVLLTPGVIIDGTKVSEGRIPRPEEIEGWIKERK